MLSRTASCSISLRPRVKPRSTSFSLRILVASAIVANSATSGFGIGSVPSPLTTRLIARARSRAGFATQRAISHPMNRANKPTEIKPIKSFLREPDRIWSVSWVSAARQRAPTGACMGPNGTATTRRRLFLSTLYRLVLAILPTCVSPRRCLSSGNVSMTVSFDNSSEAVIPKRFP